MAERSFKTEIEKMRMGNGETFHGEGVLAVTKALLQSGVSYVGGYQGAPMSHLLDVLNDAAEIRGELGVYFENSASEAGAAAMLAASIHYPLRGAVTWKSVVGTNVASDALSNVASSGVVGGCLVILGEDYGEGASIMQERSHAFAMKSQMWMVDPRPDLQSIVDSVEKAFDLSEASSTPVFFMLRIRACHVYGSFSAKDNKIGGYNTHNKIEKPIFDYSKVVLPPSTYTQEKQKEEQRWPAATRFILENNFNEFIGADDATSDIGIIVPGGLYNNVNRALELLGLSDVYGESKIPNYVLNVTYPLVDEQVKDFCRDKTAVLVLEEGFPNYIEEQIKATLHETNIATRVHGKDFLPKSGEYIAPVLVKGIKDFLNTIMPKDIDLKNVDDKANKYLSDVQGSQSALTVTIPGRPPGFCTGCPERPLYSAIKMLQEELGEFHVCGDIGCNIFSSLPPFNIGQHTMGYGLSLASSAGLAPNFSKNLISVMGDGGFWHNGLITGVANAVFNNEDAVVVIVDNGYSAATGHQTIPSTRKTNGRASPVMSIEQAVRGVGAKWVRTVDSYDIAKMKDTLREAINGEYRGLRIIISEGECMLAKQRVEKRITREKLSSGKRASRVRFGIDEDICTGDHECIRLSGCPSLSIGDNPDPLFDDPISTIDNTCVGCGNCGTVSHTAGLCPSFFRAEVISNPSIFERALHKTRSAIINLVQPR